MKNQLQAKHFGQLIPTRHLIQIIGADRVDLFQVRVPAEEDAEDVQSDDHKTDRDEAVGHGGEQSARLFQASQVRQSQHGDGQHAEGHELIRDVDVEHLRDQRNPGEVLNACGDRHGDGQHVVDQHRGPGNQAPIDLELGADVFPRDNIGAAAVGIGEDGLTIRGGNDSRGGR